MLTEAKRIAGVYGIERRALSADLTNDYVSQMAMEARSFLSAEHRTMEEQNKAVRLSKPVAGPPTSSIRPFGDFDRFAKSQEASFRLKPPRFQPIEPKSNTRFISPPYELGWSEGIAFDGMSDGSMITMHSQGFSAGGLGFHLSSPERMFATMTPSGHYDFNWASFEHYPGLSSTGGLGITVYKGGSPTPMVNRRTRLWRVSSPLPFTADRGEGFMSDLHTGDGLPALGAFASSLAPISVDMEAGASYLIWIWTWQVASLPREGMAFWAFLKCSVPTLLITTTPLAYSSVN